MKKRRKINKSKVLIRLLLISSIPITICSFILTLVNSTPEDLPSVILAKEEKSPRISEIIFPINAPTVSEIDTPTFILSRTISLDQNLELKAAESYSFNLNFDENSLSKKFGFTTSISNVAAKSRYTVIITYNGTEIYNQQHEGNIILETTNCEENQDFRIYILNTSSKQFKARLNISYFPI